MILRTEGLTKIFDAGLRRKVHAVEDLDLAVEAGEIFGFVGPNGAGKTTTIKMLMGLIFPTRGKAFIFDAPIPSEASKARIGYLPENPAYQDFLTGMEAMRFFATLAGRAARRSRSAAARSCSGWSASPTRPTGRSGSTRRACSSGSASRRRWSPTPPSWCSTSP